jgi:glycogen synthase
MRVLHLTTEYPPVIWGGLGTAVGGLATASARAGLDVAVGLITGGAPASYGGWPSPVGDSNRHRRRRSASTVSLFALPNGDAANEAVRVVRAWRPDVVHLHSFWLWGVAQAIRQHTDVPLVYTVHSLDRAEYDIGQGPPECLDQWHTQRAVIEDADRIIALTRSEQDLVTEYCPRVASRVRVVGNGIADSAAARLALRNQQRERGLVLFAGRLVDRKGVHDLLTAMPNVLREIPGSRLVLAGGHRGCSGEDMERYWLPAAARRYRDRIHFTGWLTPDDVASWYARADVLVVPSWYEPFGMVVLEGMLYGAAVAAAAVGGPSEILTHGRTGLLFPPKDPESLGEAVRRLLRDGGLRRRLADAGGAEVRRRWLWPRIVPRMRAVYSEAVEASARLRQPGATSGVNRTRGPVPRRALPHVCESRRSRPRNSRSAPERRSIAEACRVRAAHP